jgi:hypothetical protein
VPAAARGGTILEVAVPKHQPASEGHGLFRELRAAVPEGTPPNTVIEIPVPVAGVNSRITAATARLTLPPDFPAGTAPVPGGVPGHLVTVRGKKCLESVHEIHDGGGE